MSSARILLTAAIATLVCACGLIVGLKDRSLYDAGSDVQADAPCDGNVQADENNCGRCGHGCLGGLCTNGTCQPVVVATTTMDGGFVRSVTLDDTSSNIYFGSASGFMDGVIERCPASGTKQGNVTVLAASLSAPPRSIAVAAGSVYWTEVAVEGPKSVGLDGGAVTKVETANLADQLRLDNGHLYWANSMTPNTTVRTCTPPLCGSAYDTNASPALQEGSTGIAIGGTTLYIAEEFTPSLMFCTLGNCASTLTDMGVNKTADGLAADDSFVYFTDLNTTVWSCAANAVCPTPTAVATGQPTPTAIAVDGTYLYWINVGDALRVCKLPGPCTTSNTLRFAANAHGLAFDALAIYYGNGPSVMRVAKP